MKIEEDRRYYLAEADMFESWVTPIWVELVEDGKPLTKVHVSIKDSDGNKQKETLLFGKFGNNLSDMVAGCHSRRIFSNKDAAYRWIIEELDKHIERLNDQKIEIKNKLKYH